MDPYCLLHGKRWSEHSEGRCLYCAICFKPLTVEECAEIDGSKVDVCVPCNRTPTSSVSKA